MKIIWSTRAREEYFSWHKDNKKIFKRINLLIKSIQKSYYYGLGKPELLKDNLSGCWSRRITKEHRLVYYIQDNKIHILSCKFHYQ